MDPIRLNMNDLLNILITECPTLVVHNYYAYQFVSLISGNAGSMHNYGSGDVGANLAVTCDSFIDCAILLIGTLS